MDRNFSAALRALTVAAAFSFTFPLGGCMYQEYKKNKEKREEQIEQEKKEEEEVAPHRRALEVGETVVHKFAMDAAWHPAPYSFYRNHHVELKTHGESQMLGNAVVEFRIGATGMAITDETDFLVTNPGALAFRVDPKKAGTYKGECEVEITRIK